MTRLLALFAGNPLIFVGAVIAVFLFGATTGGTAAWKIQGMRVTAEQQKHTDYVQDQTRKFQEAKDAADRDREQARAAYERASKELAASVESGEVLLRCVAAGKCGARIVRVPEQSTGAAGVRFQAIPRDDGDRRTPILVAGGASTEGACEELANSAARVQLQLNQLQSEIEHQEGY